METVRLGRTGLVVNKIGFGVLPIQRVGMEEAKRILHRAVDAGVDFFDTARGYTDSEEKLGAALEPALRKQLVLATKAKSADGEALMQSLHTSLKTLRTEYVDILQVHNPKQMPAPDDGSGRYEALLEARRAGKIRFIGISAHSVDVAIQAARSALYYTVQFPFSYLSSEGDIKLTKLCAEKDVGFIAMKALSGGLLNDIFTARTWMAQHANVVPIWGIEKESELDQLFEAAKQPETLSAEQQARIEKDRKELSGEFCRGCGYCLPCPADINISQIARLSFLVNRSPTVRFTTPEWQAQISRVDDCQNCGHCSAHCPYGMDTPSLLKKNREWYRNFMETQQGVK